MLMGQEKQTLQLILMPGQSVMTKHEALLYTSDNIQAHRIKKTWRRLCLKALKTNLINAELKNDTSTIGYAGLQLMKGKVIVIDNGLQATRNMVVKDSYVIAHTSDLTLQTFNPASPDPHQRLQQREGNAGRNDILGGG